MKPWIWCAILLTGITSAERFTQPCYEQSWEDNMEYQEAQVICPEEKPLDYKAEPNICAHWCRDDQVKYKIENSQHGRVALFITPSPQHCLFTKYIVDLHLLESNSQSECSSMRDSPFKVHSELEFSISRRLTKDCVKNEIRLDFSYLFTGCYRLRITPYVGRSTHQRCDMTPLFISTDYVMNRITEPTWKAINVDSREMRVSFYWNVTYSRETSMECVDIRLYYDDDSDEEDEVMNCKLDSTPHNSVSSTYADGLIPYENTSPAVITDVGCNCMWVPGHPYAEMQCSFYNLVTGSYKVTIKVYDPRCESYTLWTEPHNHPCLWSANHSYVAANTTNYVVVPGDDSFIYLWVISGLIIAILISTVIIVVVSYFKNPPPNKEWQTEENLLIHKMSFRKPLNNKTRVLLMYPRDCQAFMDSMNAFRNLLKFTGKFEVLDALDSEIYEEVAASTNTWGLKEIADPSTKVVLIASWCSLKMYDALLGKHTLSYRETEPFDTLFSLHLNQLFQQNEPYKKIYVVRLDCDEAEKLWFEHIVQSRVFTLPQCLESLVNELLELPDLNITFDDNLEKSVAKLQSLIETYSAYCKEHPDYLNSLVECSPISETTPLIV